MHNCTEVDMIDKKHKKNYIYIIAAQRLAIKKCEIGQTETLATISPMMCELMMPARPPFPPFLFPNASPTAHALSIN